MTERERDIIGRYAWWLDEAARCQKAGAERLARVCRRQAFRELAALNEVQA